MLISLSPARGDDFLLNFVRPPDTDPNTFEDAYYGSCDAGTTCDGNDGTAFSQEDVTINGTRYFRNVVGDPASGFAYEYYTRNGAQNNFVYNQMYGLDTGGHEQLIHGNAICDNLGFGGVCGNGDQPFSVETLSGNGTGDPSKMVFRLLIDQGDGMSLEVYKPILDGKPKITQSIIDGDMRSEFISDGRALSYSDMDTAAPVINRLAIDDPGLPAPNTADFEMAMSQNSNVTAGKFIFTPGAGWNNQGNAAGWRVDDSFFDEGTYDYGSDSFDVLTVDWANYFNFAENATACNFAGSNRKNSSLASCPGGP